MLPPASTKVTATVARRGARGLGFYWRCNSNPDALSNVSTGFSRIGHPWVVLQKHAQYLREQEELEKNAGYVKTQTAIPATEPWTRGSSWRLELKDGRILRDERKFWGNGWGREVKKVGKEEKKAWKEEKKAWKEEEKMMWKEEKMMWKEEKNAMKEQKHAQKMQQQQQQQTRGAEWGGFGPTATAATTQGEEDSIDRFVDSAGTTGSFGEWREKPQQTRSKEDLETKDSEFLEPDISDVVNTPSPATTLQEESPIAAAVLGEKAPPATGAVSDDALNADLETVQRHQAWLVRKEKEAAEKAKLEADQKEANGTVKFAAAAAPVAETSGPAAEEKAEDIITVAPVAAEEKAAAEEPEPAPTPAPARKPFNTRAQWHNAFTSKPEALTKGTLKNPPATYAVDEGWNDLLGPEQYQNIAKRDELILNANHEVNKINDQRAAASTPSTESASSSASSIPPAEYEHEHEPEWTGLDSHTAEDLALHPAPATPPSAAAASVEYDYLLLSHPSSRSSLSASILHSPRDDTTPPVPPHTILRTLHSPSIFTPYFPLLQAAGLRLVDGKDTYTIWRSPSREAADALVKGITAAEAEKKVEGKGAETRSDTRIPSDAEYVAKKSWRRMQRGLRHGEAVEPQRVFMGKSGEVVTEGSERSLGRRMFWAGAWMGGLMGALGYLGQL